MSTTVTPSSIPESPVLLSAELPAECAPEAPTLLSQFAQLYAELQNRPWMRVLQLTAAQDAAYLVLQALELNTFFLWVSLAFETVGSGKLILTYVHNGDEGHLFRLVLRFQDVEAFERLSAGMLYSLNAVPV